MGDHHAADLMVCHSEVAPPACRARADLRSAACCPNHLRSDERTTSYGGQAGDHHSTVDDPLVAGHSSHRVPAYRPTACAARAGRSAWSAMADRWEARACRSTPLRPAFDPTNYGGAADDRRAVDRRRVSHSRRFFHKAVSHGQ